MDHPKTSNAQERVLFEAVGCGARAELTETTLRITRTGFLTRRLFRDRTTIIPLDVISTVQLEPATIMTRGSATVLTIKDAPVLFGGRDLGFFAGQMTVLFTSAQAPAFEKLELHIKRAKRNRGRSRGRATRSGSAEYELGISVAGTNLDYARELKSLLEEAGFSVFFYKAESAQMLGEDIAGFLWRHYQEFEYFCIALISSDYVSTDWTQLELASARYRENQDQATYIIYVRLDDALLPGLEGKVYLDSQKMDVQEVAAEIVAKIERKDE